MYHQHRPDVCTLTARLQHNKQRGGQIGGDRWRRSMGSKNMEVYIWRQKVTRTPLLIYMDSCMCEAGFIIE